MKHAARRSLLAIALCWPMLVVCEKYSDIAQYEQYSTHELALECANSPDPAEAVTLTIGATSADSIARSCLDTVPDGDQVPAAELNAGGVSARFGSASEPGLASRVALLVTCSYDIEVEPNPPATCAGTVRWNLAAELLEADIVDGPVSIVAERRASGAEPVTSLGGAVRVACGAYTDPPNTVVTVPLNGVPIHPVRLPGANVTCTLTVDIESEASAIGSSVHQILVTATAAAATACRSDADCTPNDRCSSANGTCTSGLSSNPCLSGYDPVTGFGDCSESAPICGPLGSCQDGNTGDPCAAAGFGLPVGNDVFCADGFVCMQGAYATCQPGG
jgi:hypothetical protein